MSLSSKQNFEHYKNDCLTDLMSLQPEFMKLYNINSYENWYYDHRIGKLNIKMH